VGRGGGGGGGGRILVDEVIVAAATGLMCQLRHRGGPPETRGNPEEIPTAIGVMTGLTHQASHQMQADQGQVQTVQQKGIWVCVLLSNPALGMPPPKRKSGRAGFLFPVSPARTACAAVTSTPNPTQKT